MPLQVNFLLNWTSIRIIIVVCLLISWCDFRSFTEQFLLLFRLKKMHILFYRFFDMIQVISWIYIQCTFLNFWSFLWLKLFVNLIHVCIYVRAKFVKWIIFRLSYLIFIYKIDTQNLKFLVKALLLSPAFPYYSGAQIIGKKRNGT